MRRKVLPLHWCWRISFVGCLQLCSVISVHGAPSADFPVPSKPEGFDIAAGLRYSRSSAAHEQFTEAVKNAKAFCDEYVRDHPGDRNIAVVCDLDETLFDNREAFKGKTDFTLDDWRSWIDEARAPAFKTTKSFLNWARKRGFAVFFVTGRHEHGRLATVKNLVSDGVAYDGLFMRDNGDYGPAEVGKTKLRQAIESTGFKIVVNLGDQCSDLIGGHALDCEKVPNKIYFVQ